MAAANAPAIPPPTVAIMLVLIHGFIVMAFSPHMQKAGAWPALLVSYLRKLLLQMFNLIV
jgi:hypothetical protein